MNLFCLIFVYFTVPTMVATESYELEESSFQAVQDLNPIWEGKRYKLAKSENFEAYLKELGE